MATDLDLWRTASRITQPALPWQLYVTEHMIRSFAVHGLGLVWVILKLPDTRISI